MICPICQSAIDSKHAWFCPQCFSALDYYFEDETFPQFDLNNNFITKYLPQENKRATFGRIGFIPPPKISQTNPSLSIKQKVGLMALPVASLLLSGLVWWMTNPLAGIIVFIVTMFTAVTWMTFAINSILKPAIKAVNYIPIQYYGNKDRFGLVLIDREDYKLFSKPKVKIVEIAKSDIVIVEVSEEDMIYIVHLKHNAHDDGNALYVPMVFDDKTVKAMFCN